MMQSHHITEILIEKRLEQLNSIPPHTFEALERTHHSNDLRRLVAAVLFSVAMKLDRDAAPSRSLIPQEESR